MNTCNYTHKCPHKKVYGYIQIFKYLLVYNYTYLSTYLSNINGEVSLSNSSS